MPLLRSRFWVAAASAIADLLNRVRFVQVGSEFAVSTVEQQLQIKALRTLNSCLVALTVEAPQKFDGAPAAALLTDCHQLLG